MYSTTHQTSPPDDTSLAKKIHLLLIRGSRTGKHTKHTHQRHGGVSNSSCQAGTDRGEAPFWNTNTHANVQQCMQQSTARYGKQMRVHDSALASKERCCTTKAKKEEIFSDMS